jgi:hypothetical protein
VEDTQATLSGAIHAWNSISCRGLPPAISIVLWDPIACDVAEYNATGPNANILVWVDEGWDHGVATVALTTVTFAPSTGEILGADIELNSQGFQFTVGNVGFGMDLGSTVTHELGHVLGLSHSSERDATMSPVQMPGEVGLQTLETDDVEGLCAIYPPGTPMAPCDPNYDFSPRCGGNVVGGCTVSPGRPPLRGTPATGWPGYAAFGLVAGGFRRRRKAGRAKRPGRGDD